MPRVQNHCDRPKDQRARGLGSALQEVHYPHPLVHDLRLILTRRGKQHLTVTEVKDGDIGFLAVSLYLSFSFSLLRDIDIDRPPVDARPRQMIG